MNHTQIEHNLKNLVTHYQSGEVPLNDCIYELLLSYGHLKQSVTRLKSGERNLSKEVNTIIWKKHLYFKLVTDGALRSTVDAMKDEKLVQRHKIRFVVAMNSTQMVALDTKTKDTLDVPITNLAQSFDFFLPWAGMEKAVFRGENPADVKAAEKMARLFDTIKEDNFPTGDISKENLHKLNVFMGRLLFCYFAEDTEIFADNQFSHGIASHTQEDGSDIEDYLKRLFTVLNTDVPLRKNLPDFLSAFPYVNGGLFADKVYAPNFSSKSRRLLIECGSQLDWSDINPDIFGSMFQSVIHPDQRSNMGQHYTSVPNIMKVIEPLFLNDLKEAFDAADGSIAKLYELQQRIGHLKIFDPACGSGNFLIIAYKELRTLEMEILKRIQELELDKTGQFTAPMSAMKLSQFYGIEIDDFAHEVAISVGVKLVVAFG